MLTMEEGLTLSLPTDVKYMDIKKNVSILISGVDGEISAELEPDYEQFLADVWVGIVLTLMVLSCVCCMCSCLLYHKFQQWKRNVIQARNAANLESGTVDSELPSYTIASGLPTYQEALEQLKQVKELAKTVQKSSDSSSNTATEWVPRTPPTPLSVVHLFPALCNNKADCGSSTSSKPS